MAEGKDTDFTISNYPLPVTRINKSIIALQKVASAYLNTPE